MCRPSAAVNGRPSTACVRNDAGGGRAGRRLLFVLVTLPAGRDSSRPEMPGSQAARVSGAYHVHSTQSDGSGDRAAVAAAAHRAGLQFVIFTDHGDATRSPAPPAYLSGVLCVDGVEVSTDGRALCGARSCRSAVPAGRGAVRCCRGRHAPGWFRVRRTPGLRAPRAGVVRLGGRLRRHRMAQCR